MKGQVKDTHIYFPVRVLSELKKLAQLNRRTASAEIVIAVEKHISEAKVINGGKPKERK